MIKTNLKMVIPKNHGKEKNQRNQNSAPMADGLSLTFTCPGFDCLWTFQGVISWHDVDPGYSEPEQGAGAGGGDPPWQKSELLGLDAKGSEFSVSGPPK